MPTSPPLPVRLRRAAGAAPIAVLGVILVAVIVAASVVLLPAGPAAAHNSLRSATPEREATLTAPPTEVVLEFAQSLNPAYTTIVVTDAARQRVATSEPVVTGTRGSVTFTEPLTDGGYTVAYRVVSADGHPVQGSYPFTVGQASGSTPSPNAAASTPATPAGIAEAAGPDSDDNGGVSGWLIAAGTVALVVLLAGTGYLLWRRRPARR
ncbi:copper resistance CopC family protein [Micromonospora sp. NPDC003197]